MGSKNGKPVLRGEDIAAIVRTSGMDEKQVRDNFDAFIAEYPNGQMKPKVFRDMMTKVMPKKDASKMEKHVFRVYDANDDGLVGFAEFMVIYYVMSEGTPEDVLTKIFRVFDVNSDGCISMKEMARLIKDMYGLLKTEDPKIAAKDMIAKSAFAEMDQNMDGKVTTDEFISACMGQAEISQLLALKVIEIFVEDI
eukprot:GFUD01039161.1.p1 GENE.GFUD01039161.1~~GFUD01039161.1.p1  ORF type:complete len:195 (-),score=62.79 GFUD01039161.1:30-614(-)